MSKQKVDVLVVDQETNLVKSYLKKLRSLGNVEIKAEHKSHGGIFYSVSFYDDNPDILFKIGRGKSILSKVEIMVSEI